MHGHSGMIGMIGIYVKKGMMRYKVKRLLSVSACNDMIDKLNVHHPDNSGWYDSCLIFTQCQANAMTVRCK